MKIISGTLDREKRTLNARLTNVNLLERARLAPGRAGAVLSLYGGMPLLRIRRGELGYGYHEDKTE